MKKILVVLLLITTLFLLVGCGSKSSYSAKPGECVWCDGVGWYMGADANGKMTVRKTCPHCHGTGLAR